MKKALVRFALRELVQQGVRELTQQQCEFWNCDRKIPKGHFYCREHYEGFRIGEIDDCPKCGRGKQAQYETCLGCRPARPYREEYSPAWEVEDSRAREFFVYILQLNNGKFYAGQTRELRERLMEHRAGTTRSTAGKNPKLVWFAVLGSRRDATAAEVELKELCDKNPREVRRLIIDFRDLVKELDYS
ncbi:MAG: GIY-YIG nuclease family protein [Chloroflexota bacterium]|nr:GIY-YIG nuclease family protein [Chloroflexota bacterium]